MPPIDPVPASAHRGAFPVSPGLAVALVVPPLLAIAAALSLVPVSPSPRYAALAAVLSAVFFISILRLRDEISLLLFLRRFRSGLAAIEGGDYALRFRSGSPAALDEVLRGVNALLGLLESVRAESIRSESMRKSLLSDISHDIRTPLASIIGYVDALRDGVASDSREREEYLGILSSKSRALKAMIDDVFSLAKLDADEMPLYPETFDACEAVREILIEFLPEARAAGIAIETDIPDSPCPAFADTTAFARVVRNLVQNALQHGADDGLIRASVGEVERGGRRFVAVTVADRGEGIPPRDLPLVFTRLYRRDPSRGGPRRGSGLGLAIVQSIVAKSGGDAVARSEAGGETSFEVSFPSSGRTM